MYFTLRVSNFEKDYRRYFFLKKRKSNVTKLTLFFVSPMYGSLDDDYNFSVNPNIINNVEGSEHFTSTINDCTKKLSVLLQVAQTLKTNRMLMGFLTWLLT